MPSCVAVATMCRSRALVAGLLLVGCSSQETFEPVGPNLSPATTAPQTPRAVSPPALVPYVGDRFTILLPGPGLVEKDIANQGAAPVEYTTVTGKSPGHSYSVTYFARPQGFDQDDQARKAAEVSGGTLVDLRSVSFKGHRGRDFRIAQVKTNEGMITFFNRSLLVKGRIYLVQATYGGDVTAAPDLYRQVVESLTLTS